MIDNSPDFQRFRVFSGPGASGNSAAVTLLEKPLSDGQMLSCSLGQAPATAVFLRALGPNEYRVRWFGAGQEIHRCGHGALAAAEFLRRRQGSQAFSGKLMSQRGEPFPLSADASGPCRVQLRPLSLGSTGQSRELQSLCGAVAAAGSAGEAGYAVVDLASQQAVIQFDFAPRMAAALNGAALIVASD